MGTTPVTRSSPDGSPDVRRHPAGRPRRFTGEGDRSDPVTEPAVDPRTATAQRNAAALLDATERLLARRVPLSMVAIAAEARLSRPTLYAHFRSIAEVVEAAVERSVSRSLTAFAAAEPEAGPPDAALLRMAETSWEQLGRYEPLVRAASDHLDAGALHRSHEAMMAPLRGLIDRGRTDGTFRTDLPAEWLLSMYFALLHGAEEYVAGHGADRAAALQALETTLLDVFTAPASR